MTWEAFDTHQIDPDGPYWVCWWNPNTDDDTPANWCVT